MDVGAGIAGGALVNPSLELLDIDELRPHERTRPDLLNALIAEIKRDGKLKLPILVERSHQVILDGHHRAEALRALGCVRVPSYVVDYFSEEIRVTTWPDASVDHVTKEEVLERGRTGNLFPPKTTRHLVKGKLAESPVALRDLMQAARARSGA